MTTNDLIRLATEMATELDARRSEHRESRWILAGVVNLFRSTADLAATVLRDDGARRHFLATAFQRAHASLAETLRHHPEWQDTAVRDASLACLTLADEARTAPPDVASALVSISQGA